MRLLAIVLLLASPAFAAAAKKTAAPEPPAEAAKAPEPPPAEAPKPAEPVPAPAPETPKPPEPAAIAPPPAPAPLPGIERWYRPKQGDPSALDAPKAQWASLYALSLRADRHGFVSTAFFRLPGVGHMFSGSGTEYRLRFGSPLVGASLGIYEPGGDYDFGHARSVRLTDSGLFSFGTDFDLLAGVPLTNIGDAFTLWLTTPSFEPRVFFRPDLSQALVTVGTNLTGLRLVWRDFAFDLQGPRFDFWCGPFNSAFTVRMSVGLALSATWVF